MAAFTNIPVNFMLDWLTGLTTPTAVATRYITTFLGDPQSGGVENISTLTGSANRIDMTTAMAAASAGVAASDTDIVFTTSASGAVVVDYVAVYTAITGGSLYASSQVVSKSVGVGEGLRILAGNLTFAII